MQQLKLLQAFLLFFLINLCFWLGGWNHPTRNKMFPDDVPTAPSDHSDRPAGHFWESVSATASGLLLANVRGKKRHWIKVRNCCFHVLMEASLQPPCQAVVFDGARRKEGDCHLDGQRVPDIHLLLSRFFTPSFKSEFSRREREHFLHPDLFVFVFWGTDLCAFERWRQGSVALKPWKLEVVIRLEQTEIKK